MRIPAEAYDRELSRARYSTGEVVMNLNFWTFNLPVGSEGPWEVRHPVINYPAIATYSYDHPVLKAMIQVRVDEDGFVQVTMQSMVNGSQPQTLASKQYYNEEELLKDVRMFMRGA